MSVTTGGGPNKRKLARGTSTAGAAHVPHGAAQHGAAHGAHGAPHVAHGAGAGQHAGPGYGGQYVVRWQPNQFHGHKHEQSARHWPAVADMIPKATTITTAPRNVRNFMVSLRAKHE
jgi:hypothetical protein